MKLVWDVEGQHYYETGVDHAVLYPIGTTKTASGSPYTPGVAWNGITGVTESPSGAEANPIYADNIKYLNLFSIEEFGATITAYTYPDEFKDCNGEATPTYGEEGTAEVTDTFTGDGSETVFTLSATPAAGSEFLVVVAGETVSTGYEVSGTTITFTEAPTGAIGVTYSKTVSAVVLNGLSVGQQNRKNFGLSYRTKLGSDESDEYGYKLHLIYNAKASPSEKAYATVNDSPEAIEFSWELTTTPVAMDGFKNTASITIESPKFSAAQMKAIEDVLYGTPSSDPYLPLPNEVVSLLGGAL